MLGSLVEIINTKILGVVCKPSQGLPALKTMSKCFGYITKTIILLNTYVIGNIELLMGIEIQYVCLL